MVKDETVSVSKEPHYALQLFCESLVASRQRLRRMQLAI